MFRLPRLPRSQTNEVEKEAQNYLFDPNLILDRNLAAEFIPSSSTFSLGPFRENKVAGLESKLPNSNNLYVYEP